MTHRGAPRFEARDYINFIQKHNPVVLEVVWISAPFGRHIGRNGWRLSDGSCCGTVFSGRRGLSCFGSRMSAVIDGQQLIGGQVRIFLRSAE